MISATGPERPDEQLRDRDPPHVAGLDVRACPGLPAEVAHHHGIRVELDLPLEMLVGERDQREALRVQGLLGHRPIVLHTRPCLQSPFLSAAGVSVPMLQGPRPTF